MTLPRLRFELVWRTRLAGVWGTLATGTRAGVTPRPRRFVLTLVKFVRIGGDVVPPPPHYVLLNSSSYSMVYHLGGCG